MAHGNINLLSLSARHKLGLSRVEKVKLFGATAQSGVILLHKEPANLVLGDIVLGIASGGRGRGASLLGSVVSSGSIGSSVRGVVGVGGVRVWLVVAMVGAVDGGRNSFGSHRVRMKLEKEKKVIEAKGRGCKERWLFGDD